MAVELIVSFGSPTMWLAREQRDGRTLGEGSIPVRSPCEWPFSVANAVAAMAERHRAETITVRVENDVDRDAYPYWTFFAGGVCTMLQWCEKPYHCRLAFAHGEGNVG